MKSVVNSVCRADRGYTQPSPSFPIDSGGQPTRALGMGVSFVPIRALALYGRKRSLHRLALPERFSRELVVLVRKHRKLPEHVARFVEGILFGGSST